MSELTVDRHGCFYSGKYLVLPSGEAVVAPPKFCHKSTASGCCDIRLHCKVERKCGPGYKLAVHVCRIHRVTMRVYPEGWTPYSREPIVGRDSVFFLLASLAHATDIPMRGVAGRSLKTLYRKLELALSLLGCLEVSTESCRCDSAQVLGIATITLNNLFEEIRAGPNLRGRAEALISAIDPHTTTTKKWILCGTQKKCWGKNISD